MDVDIVHGGDRRVVVTRISSHYGFGVRSLWDRHTPSVVVVKGGYDGCRHRHSVFFFIVRVTRVARARRREGGLDPVCENRQTDGQTRADQTNRRTDSPGRGVT